MNRVRSAGLWSPDYQSAFEANDSISQATATFAGSTRK